LKDIIRRKISIGTIFLIINEGFGFDDELLVDWTAIE